MRSRTARSTLTAALLGLALQGSGLFLGAQAPSPTLVLPDRDPSLQTALERILRQPPYRPFVEQGRISVALVDLTDPDRIRYAGVDDDRMRYAASLPKIGILLGVFDQIERGRVRYTPGLRSKMEGMIRRSDNGLSSELIRLVGFPAIAQSLRDARHQLYEPSRKGGIWVGRGYGNGVGLWRRDPIANTSHGATARQAARFLAMMDRGMLVSPWASREMKDILGDPAIHHKFVKGLDDSHPEARVFRKSGTWRQWHADAALVERDGRKYVAVALLESPTRSAGNVFSSLIVRLDDAVFRTEPVTRRAEAR